MTETLLLGLTFLGAVLASLVAVRYEAKLVRRQNAADSLIEWAYGAGALLGDAFENWCRYMNAQDEETSPCGDQERTVRLNHERYMMRLPESIQAVLRPHTTDLLMMLNVTLTKFPIPAFTSSTWTNEPPSNVLEVRGSHSNWLALIINQIIETLEPFAATGRRPKGITFRVSPPA